MSQLVKLRLLVKATSSRCLCTMVPAAHNKERTTTKNYNFTRAISEAEKITGYPTSFMTLKWLLGEETYNLTAHFQKLVVTNHPLLKTLMYNGRSVVQAWGLIVMLISKAAGHATTIPAIERDNRAGVLHSQRSLAEITEMIRVSHSIHQSIVNIDPSLETPDSVRAMMDANKIALLFGDYLLTTANSEIAKLRNQAVGRLISTALRDLCDSSFIGDRDEQENPLPADPRAPKSNANVPKDFTQTDNMLPYDLTHMLESPESEWTMRHICSTGSLLGKSCQAALMLAKLPEHLQHQIYCFGKHVALAWQTKIDLEPYQSAVLSEDKLSLISAPVIFHLHHHPNVYKDIQKGKKSVEDIDYEKLHAEVRNGPGVEETKRLAEKHGRAAMEILTQHLPESDARHAVENILEALRKS